MAITRIIGRTFKIENFYVLDNGLGLLVHENQTKLFKQKVIPLSEVSDLRIVRFSILGLYRFLLLLLPG